MKTIITGLLLSSILCFTALAQEKEFYLNKIDHYKNVKNTGATIGFIGIPVVVAGVIIYKTGIKNSNSNDDEVVEGFFQVPIGLALTIVGTGAFIMGVILNSMGNRRMKEYQDKLKNLQAGFYIAPGLSGFTLTYRF